MICSRYSQKKVHPVVNSCHIKLLVAAEFLVTEEDSLRVTALQLSWTEKGIAKFSSALILRSDSGGDDCAIVYTDQPKQTSYWEPATKSGLNRHKSPPTDQNKDRKTATKASVRHLLNRNESLHILSQTLRVPSDLCLSTDMIFFRDIKSLAVSCTYFASSS